MSQEIAETPEQEHEDVEDRITHVESLVDRLIERQDFCQPAQLSRSSQNSTARSTRGPSISSLTLHYDPQNALQSLSNYLQTALPRSTLAVQILKEGEFLRIPSQILRRPLKTLEGTVGGPESLDQVSKLPSSNAHPVQFARKLIQLAICLQHLDSSPAGQVHLPLAESARDAARRYVDIASRHVTSQDLLIESMEGLETLMLQANYHINVGDLRLAWLIIRRALGIGQLLNFHRMPEMSSFWFRLLYSDRYLSLMSGLPVTVVSAGLTETADGDTQKLEHLHLALVDRIVARNLRLQSRRHLIETEEELDYKDTKGIDMDLKKAARTLPSKWWALPILQKSDAYEAMAEKANRLHTQTHQYYLLVLLHLPYSMKRFHPGPCGSDAEHRQSSADHVYSKLAGISAGRDLLSRFVMFCNFYKTPSYRGLEAKAYVAAATLLVGHIEGHRLGRANVLEHQRPSDLALTESVISLMEALRSLDKAAPIGSKPQLLRRLVNIEAQAANGAPFFAWIEQEVLQSENNNAGIHELEVQLPIPYLGMIRVAQQEPACHRTEWAAREVLQSEGLAPRFTTAYQETESLNDISDPSEEILAACATQVLDSIELQPHDGIVANSTYGFDEDLSLQGFT